MPDTQEADKRQEAENRGLSDSARKARPIVAPPPPLEGDATAPAPERAAGDVISTSARQPGDIMRSWEAAMCLGLDSFAAWTHVRGIWAEGCQELLRSSFNATQQATKMMAQTSAQLFSLTATLVAGASQPLNSRFGEAP
jgi:hypothetical protein